MRPKGEGAWEQITPKKAMSMLQRNTNNYRRMNRKAVIAYANAMKAGAWEENGEPIVVDEDGQLKDGQNRLAAVAESGVTLNMFVIRGVSRDVVIYDEGKKRSGVDHARNAGVSTNTRVITLARKMVGDWNDFLSTNAANYHAIIAYARDHGQEIEMALSCVRAGKGTNGSIDLMWAYLCAYMLIRDGFNADKIHDFCLICNSGMPITGTESTPALVLRRQYCDGAPVKRSNLQIVENMCNLANALEDFAAGRARKIRYATKDGLKWTPETIEALWHRIRVLDGIEKTS